MDDEEEKLAEPLNQASIDLVNSIIKARIPEENILRAYDEEPAAPPELVALRRMTDEILDAIPRGSIAGAINWADLKCVEVQRVENDQGGAYLQVVIEEAAPENAELQRHVSAQLAEREFQNVAVITE